MKSWIVSYVYFGKYDRVKVMAASRRLAYQAFRDVMFLVSPQLYRAALITKITSSRRAHDRIDRQLARMVGTD